VLVATAQGGEGGPAAALAYEHTTLLGRLLEQLGDLGIRAAHVITRPDWAPLLAPSIEGRGLAVRLHPSADLSADLRAVEAIALDGSGAVVVADAGILTQREALAGLLADPRIATGMLTTTRAARSVEFPTRTRRGRVLSAGSPYHHVGQPNGAFLGVLKVAPAHRGELAAVAGRIASLVDGPLPEGWQDELDAKAAALGTGPEDVPALMLCGLVRTEVKVGTSRLRRLLWTRPLTAEQVAAAAARIGEHDEDRALLDSSVKAADGFFTTFFVSPYSKYIARWAARRGWTPNGVTTLSAAIGFAAAAAFATGDRWGMIAGAILLQLAFTFDCVDGQLARYTRTFSKLGAWLDSIFDRTKEYAIYAGLAIGAAQTGDDVWLLAGAALALQVMRHAVDFSYPQASGAVRQPPLEQVHDVLGPTLPPPHAPGARTVLRAVDRSPRGRWIKKIVGFPIGERLAAISLTAALFDARTTFVVLLACGGFAALYTAGGRLARALGRRGAAVLDHAEVAGAGTLDAYRDDGPLALALGRLPLPPLPASVLVLAGTGALLAVIAIAGDGASWPLAGATLAALIVLAGVSAGRPLRDRLRWAVPPALRAGEYAGILWVAAIAGPSAVPAAFALLLAITFHHYDTVYRLRHRGIAPRWLNRAAGGWDGRLLASCALAAAAAVPAGLYAAAALLGIVFVAESVASWATFARGDQGDDYEDEEDEE